MTNPYVPEPGDYVTVVDYPGVKPEERFRVTKLVEQKNGTVAVHCFEEELVMVGGRKRLVGSKFRAFALTYVRPAAAVSAKKGPNLCERCDKRGKRGDLVRRTRGGRYFHEGCRRAEEADE